ncbi:GTR11 protein, partial [Urocynchramus pylzowi]|nr:GTR11 protein [Urocynchramus pylzowi]
SQIPVKEEKVKYGSYPLTVFFARCCRKKSLLLNDVVLITATLLTGFSRRAKSFEMILAGRLLEGIAAGRTRHWPVLM